VTTVKRLFRRSIVYAVGNVGRQLVGFVMLPVYTRYLSPADYGVVGLMVTAVTFLEAAFGARMMNAVPKFFHESDDDGSRRSVVTTALITTGMTSTVMMFAAMALSAPLSRFVFGSQDFQLLMAVGSTLLLSQAVEQYGFVFIRLQDRPWLFVSLSLAKLALQVALNLALVVGLEAGAMGVAISAAVSSAVFGIGLATFVFASCGFSFKRELVRKLVSFSWPLWASGLALIYMGSATRYLLRVFSSLSDVGLFEVAARFAAVIPVLLWAPFELHWQMERFVIYKQPDALRTYQRVFRLACAVLFMAAAGLGLFGKFVVALMASDEFHRAGEAIVYLAFAGVFLCLNSFVNFGHMAMGKTGWIAVNTYLTAAVLTILCMLLIPTYGFVGAAVALMVTRAAQFGISFASARRHYDMKLPMLLAPAMFAVSGFFVFAPEWLDNGVLWHDLAIRCLALLVAVIAALVLMCGGSAGRDLIAAATATLRQRERD